MAEVTVDPDRLWAKESPSILERTLIAEYLLSEGYLMTDLKKLPPQVAKSLISEARRFTALKMAKIVSRDEFRSKIRLPIILN